MEKTPELWEAKSSKLEADCRIFKVYRSIFEHPTRQKQGDFFVIDSPNWVHVVALTPQDELVMVQQFRFGTRNLSWEIPGGLMEPNETPVEAATRELREETGYEGSSAELIATISPNPAIQSNTCFFVLVRDAIQTKELDWDEHEEILTRAIPVEEVEQWAYEGKIVHSLSLTSLFFLRRHRKP